MIKEFNETTRVPPVPFSKVLLSMADAQEASICDRETFLADGEQFLAAIAEDLGLSPTSYKILKFEVPVFSESLGEGFGEVYLAAGKVGFCLKAAENYPGFCLTYQGDSGRYDKSGKNCTTVRIGVLTDPGAYDRFRRHSAALLLM
jgi:hypothetical protein